jgi:phage-related protein
MSKKPNPKTIQQLRINSLREKDVIWWPEKLTEEIKKNWPEKMCKEVGFQLGRVQQGLDPDNYKPMPSIGMGVKEIRLQDEDKSQYRLIYIASFQESIYAFHVITRKTTEQTSHHDIQIAKKRLSEIKEHRQKKRNL